MNPFMLLYIEIILDCLFHKPALACSPGTEKSEALRVIVEVSGTNVNQSQKGEAIDQPLKLCRIPLVTDRYRITHRYA
jgi:hypothetical protein